MNQKLILIDFYKEARQSFATELQGNIQSEDTLSAHQIFDRMLGGSAIPLKKQKQGSLNEVNKMTTKYCTHLINLLYREESKCPKNISSLSYKRGMRRLRLVLSYGDAMKNVKYTFGIAIIVKGSPGFSYCRHHRY